MVVFLRSRSKKRGAFDEKCPFLAFESFWLQKAHIQEIVFFPFSLTIIRTDFCLSKFCNGVLQKKLQNIAIYFSYKMHFIITHIFVRIFLAFFEEAHYKNLLFIWRK